MQRLFTIDPEACAGLSPGLAIVEPHGDIALVAERASPPAASWWKAQSFVSMRSARDANLRTALLIGGGSLVVFERNAVALGAPSEDLIREAVEHANIAGRRTIGALYPRRSSVIRLHSSALTDRRLSAGTLPHRADHHRAVTETVSPSVASAACRLSCALIKCRTPAANAFSSLHASRIRCHVHSGLVAQQSWAS